MFSIYRSLGSPKLCRLLKKSEISLSRRRLISVIELFDCAGRVLLTKDIKRCWGVSAKDFVPDLTPSCAAVAIRKTQSEGIVFVATIVADGAACAVEAQCGAGGGVPPPTRGRLQSKVSDRVKAFDEVLATGESAGAPGASGGRKTVILYLPPYGLSKEISYWFGEIHRVFSTELGKDKGGLRVVQFDPPYEDDTPEATLHYMKPHHHTADGRRKLLRKQIFASIVAVMNELSLIHI